MTAFTSREFNQDTGRAKKAAEKGPVFITDRGEPAHVLLSIADYRKLVRGGPRITELLSMPPGIEDIEFEVERLRDLPRPVDFD